MATTKTEYAHIQVGAAGVAEIAGTGMKVVELAVEYNTFGWTPEEIYTNHPYLTLGQIYSALAYYWDHKAEVDADSRSRAEYAEKLRQKAEPSPLEARLRASSVQSAG